MSASNFAAIQWAVVKTFHSHNCQHQSMVRRSQEGKIFQSWPTQSPWHRKKHSHTFVGVAKNTCRDTNEIIHIQQNTAWCLFIPVLCCDHEIEEKKLQGIRCDKAPSAEILSLMSFLIAILQHWQYSLLPSGTKITQTFHLPYLHIPLQNIEIRHTNMYDHGCGI